jgi:hypothetical protein
LASLMNFSFNTANYDNYATPRLLNPLRHCLVS